MTTTNSNPTGTATASLSNAVQDMDYVISASTLLQGFSDPDGDTLSIANLVFYHGTSLDNGDGTFTLTPIAGFNGGAAVGYDVVDGKGGSTGGSQTFMIVTNTNPIGTAVASLPAGFENTDYVVSAATLLQGFSDADGDTLSITNLVFHQGSISNNGDGTYTLTPNSGFNGMASMAFDVVDGKGGLTLGSQTFRINDIADAGNNSLFGTSGDDSFNALAGSDTLSGFDGNDTLDGGADADSMTGGYGNDTYIVDNANDVIIEVGGQGSDTVQSSISFNIGNIHIEDLQLSGSAANGTGNWLNNSITGTAGNNELNGKGGADALIGGDGDDIYFVDNAADAVVELLNQGIDRVHTVTSYTLSSNIERLNLTGFDAINANGNELANILRGNAANNQITGGAGKDLLYGSGGNDSFIIDGINSDSDLVMDFASTVDKLVLDISAVGAIGNGNTSVDNAIAGNTYSSANELVIVSTQISGALSKLNAVAAIGTSTDTLAQNSQIVFVVDNGIDTAVYVFTGSADNNNQVAFNELQLVAILKGVNDSAIADYQFQA